jgi:hypothetical protein
MTVRFREGEASPHEGDPSVSEGEPRLQRGGARFFEGGASPRVMVAGAWWGNDAPRRANASLGDGTMNNALTPVTVKL